MENIKVNTTTNYKRFKRLDGNRSVNDGRVQKIIKSIEQVGYLPVPLIVNERYEVIDGQGRLKACEDLGLPVYYIVVNGLGIEECIAMNINQKNWTIMDYIKSYAERGNVSYKYLLLLCESYGRLYGVRTCFYAAKGVRIDAKTAQKGNIKVSEKEYDNARFALTWLVGLRESVREIGGAVENFYEALLFCFNNPDIDNEKLAAKFKNAVRRLKPAASIAEAMAMIEEVYDYRNPKKTYIATQYRRHVDMRATAYRKEWKAAR